jgi:RHS repeat-associated protein
MAGGRPQRFPALAADSQGVIYLAYEYNRFSFSGELKVDRREASSGLWSNDPTLGDPEFEAGDPPALAVDSQDNLYVTWGFYDFGQQLAVKKRLAGDGSWEDVNIFSQQAYGLDMVVDAFDAPQVISGDPADENHLHIFVNGDSIFGDNNPMPNAGYPTIAVGPKKTLVAIWQASAQPFDAPKRLYLATKGLQVTKHYYANGQRIATRVDGELYYIHGDHLGSTSLVTDESGNEVSKVHYSPYGSIIEQSGFLPTDRLYTGQRREESIELYDYRARFYDPLTANFLSPDTIVPQPGNPADWNRYAYVRGNPVRYSDPSGHCPPSVCNGLDLAMDPYYQYDPYLAWNSGQYSGCFMCHAAVANNQIILTNEELAAIDYQIRAAGLASGENMIRSLDLIDVPMTMVDCSDGCDPNLIFFTIFLTGGLADDFAEGIAVVKRYQYRNPQGRIRDHVTVMVKYGDEILETEQYGYSGFTRIVEVTEPHILGKPIDTLSINLPNAEAALEAQRSMLSIRRGAPYAPVTNSCATHVCQVLRAGGIDVKGGDRHSLEAYRFLKALRKLK